MNFIKYIKLLLISISCAFLFTACATTGTKDSPEAVAKEFVTAMTNADTDRFLELMDTSDIEAAELDQMRPKLETIFQMMKQELDEKGGIKSIDVVSSEIAEDGNTAQVTLKMTMGNGESEDMPPMPLKKVDGKWKVADN